jgi:protein gp37
MKKHKIEWTGLTWNPTTGCDKISAGCRGCYAEVMSKRLKGMGQEKYKNGFKLTLHQDELQRPFTWKKPTTVFVDSMSDLFHKDVPVEFIQKVFQVMKGTPQHTYQILTKRSDRLLELDQSGLLHWSENVWMGVSVEDEKVMYRVDHLRETKAQTKFLSCEPLIGPLPNIDLATIDWVIVGGESGHNCREAKIMWMIDLVNACKVQGVAAFVKQLGTYLAKQWDFQHPKGGDIEEFPHELSALKVRQFPSTRKALV